MISLTNWRQAPGPRRIFSWRQPPSPNISFFLFFSFLFLFCFLWYPTATNTKFWVVEHNWLRTDLRFYGRGLQSFFLLFSDFFFSCTQPRQNTKKSLVNFKRDIFLISNIVPPNIVPPNIVPPNIVSPYKNFQGSKEVHPRSCFWNQNFVSHTTYL